MEAICAVKKTTFDGVDCEGGDSIATGTVRIFHSAIRVAINNSLPTYPLDSGDGGGPGDTCTMHIPHTSPLVLFRACLHLSGLSLALPSVTGYRTWG